MPKILLVDNDQDFLEAAQLVLSKEGYEISRAHNIEDGMSAIKDVAPDLLILDIMMERPDDGVAMARQLHREGFAAPILMLTSISKVGGLNYGEDADLPPVDAFLEKPVSPQRLLSKVRELLEKKVL